MTFAEKLVEVREAAGMTQQALAEAASVPLSSLRKYEQGTRTKVPFAAVAKLAKALNTDCTAFAACEDVIDQDEPEPPAKPEKKPKGKKG